MCGPGHAVSKPRSGETDAPKDIVHSAALGVLLAVGNTLEKGLKYSAFFTAAKIPRIE